MSNANGSHWIRTEKRQRIYARDKRRCLWCGREPCAGEPLTLDHFLARSAGGCNHATNLLTACYTCNSGRQDKPALVFAFEVGGSKAKAARILERVITAMATPLPEVA
jgi:hypothetical protein